MNQKLPVKHNFTKFHEQTTAKLLDVEIVSYSELDEEMIEADTLYYEKVTAENTEAEVGKVCYAKLKKGSLILLSFKGNKNIHFGHLVPFKDTTKLKKKKQIGEVFDIVIKEEKPKVVETQEALEV